MSEGKWRLLCTTGLYVVSRYFFTPWMVRIMFSEDVAYTIRSHLRLMSQQGEIIALTLLLREYLKH